MYQISFFSNITMYKDLQPIKIILTTPLKHFHPLFQTKHRIIHLFCYPLTTLHTLFWAKHAQLCHHLLSFYFSNLKSVKSKWKLKLFFSTVQIVFCGQKNLYKRKIFDRRNVMKTGPV